VSGSSIPPGITAKYEIRGTLGAGAMGVVYDAWDRLIERRVAIKVVRRPAGNDPEALEAHARFRREAQAAGRLQHPNIVAVYDYGEDENAAWIVMELVEGGSLKKLLDAKERFPLPEIVRVMTQVLEALDYSHKRGVVHRDIKPANVMLGEGGQVKLADFGIARIENSSMTQVGQVMGTPSYMAPEQLRGEPVDLRADIWAAGVLLYQLLTGAKPFEGDFVALSHRVLHTEPPPPSALSVTCPKAFDAVVAKALAKRPEDRYPSAAAFAEAIRAAASGTRPGAAPLPTPETDATMVAARVPAGPTAPAAAAGPAARRGPPWALIGGGLAAAAIAAAAVFLLMPGSAPPPGESPSPATLAERPATQPAPGTAAVSPPGVLSPPAPTAPQAADTSPPTPTTPVPLLTPPQTVLLAPQPATPPQADVATGPQAATPPQAIEAPPQPAPPSPPPVPSGTLALTPPARPGAPEQPGTAAPQPPPAAPPTLPQTATVSPPVPPAAPPHPETAAPQPAPPSPPPVPSGTLALTPPARPGAPEQPGVAAPQPPPAAPPQQTALLVPLRPDYRAAATAALAAAPCGLIAASAGESGLHLLGVAPRSEAQAVAAVLAGRAISPGDPAARVQIQVFDGPYCPVVVALRSVLAGPAEAPRVVVDGRMPLRRGELLRFDVTMPDWPAHLYVAYFMKSGEVANLVPSERRAPGARVRLGDPAPGFPGWEVAEPFGTDLMVVVASEQPLFPSARPFVEAQESYLAALSAALEGARRQGARVLVRPVVVETADR
jgi:predicted Ser/Thr protein kinase